MEVTTFSLKDYYDNLGVTQNKTKEGDELKKDDDIGGIPIPFMGWAQIDQEDTEKMLRDQLHMVNHKLQQANQVIDEQRKVLELHQGFIKEQNLFSLWMFFVGDRKDV
jgi:hypothetical protein